MTGLDLGPILFTVVGTDDYNILKYDDDDSMATKNHTKGIIWFTSNGKQGSIELGLKFFDKSITDFVILSRCVEGEVGLGFSPNIFNVSSTVADVTLYFEDINMNSRSIKNHGGPIDDGDVTNKKYVDEQNAKQDIAINDKANKSYVDDENIKLLNYIDGAVEYSYTMTSFIHNNSKKFIFEDKGSKFFKPNDSDNTKLDIMVVGKYKIKYSDMFKGKGKVEFKISNDNQIHFTGELDYSNWSALTINSGFVTNAPTTLEIVSTGTLLLDGYLSGSQNFELTLISDLPFKKYIDDEIDKIDFTPLLPRDGSRPMSGDLDLHGNNILRVENLTDYKDTDPYDYRVKDVKSVVNKEYLNENFMKKVDKDGKEYYDTKGRKITGSGPYNKDLFDHPDDLVSKAYVDDVNATQDTTINNISDISSYNTNLITSLQTGKVDQQYVDDNFLNLDGSKSMNGNLNMGGNYIDGLPELVEDDTSDETLAKIKGRAIDFGYFKKQRDALKNFVTEEVGDDLPKDGSEPMKGNLNMNDHEINNITKITMTPGENNVFNAVGNSIVNVKTPLFDSFAANKGYVDKKTNDNRNIINTKVDEKFVKDEIDKFEQRNISSNYKENVFKKVMDDGLFIEDDDDIKNIGKVDKDFHKVNKQTYHFRIDYDSSIGYYSSRLGVNVVYLPIGFYILCFEMYFTDKIDHQNITVNCLSGTLQILSKNTKYSSDHSRSIFNFRKTVARPSDDELDIDISLKNKNW